MRAPPEALVAVDGEEVLLFFVRVFCADAPVGQRLPTANMQTQDYEPHPGNYGPSVFVESKATVDAIVEHRPKWRDRRAVRVPTKELLAAGIDVRWSPDDCDVEALKPAHASLLGVTRANRQAVLALLDKFVT